MPEKRILVEGKFNGIASSKGYQPGETYTIYIAQMGNGNIMIYPKDKDTGTESLSYISFITFLHNWTNIVPLNEL